MEEAPFRDWVEAEVGAGVRRFARAGTGASRATYLVDLEADPRRSVVLRVDTGDGPLSGTPLDLRREAAVYRALADTAVRIPRLLAVHPSGRALLVERAVGSDAFASAEPAAKEAIARDYHAALAELHRLDPGALDVPELGPAGDAASATRRDLALWRGILASRAADADPLAPFAAAWLAGHVPSGAEPARLCHGDAGPGNFLFEGTRVTALLDWEFAHAGDPADDLAWVAVRAQLLGGFGSARDNLAAWQAASGSTVDAERIEYYRALVLLRMAISCLAALAHAGSDRRMDTTVYTLLLPYLRYLLPQALAHAGCDEPGLAEHVRAGEAAVAASPVLRDHAVPLTPLEMP